MRYRRLDLTGWVSGKLAVLGFSHRTEKRVYMWTCRCECGNVRAFAASDLHRRKARSCGCSRYSPDPVVKRPLFKCWAGMRDRCNNARRPDYRRYGGRGIRVCRRWEESFRDFETDMGPRPSRDYSLDRIDVNGHYSCGHCADCIANGWPANCRWATLVQQATNTRANARVTIDGVTLCLADWARRTGIRHGAICNRYHRGDRGRDLIRPLRSAGRQPG